MDTSTLALTILVLLAALGSVVWSSRVAGTMKPHNLSWPSREFHIHPLATGDWARFAVKWRHLEKQFGKDPQTSVAMAGGLVEEVMSAEGYPVLEFEKCAADISVDHPAVVENYRATREIDDRNRRGAASMEDLRKALAHYRALFGELLGPSGLSAMRR